VHTSVWDDSNCVRHVTRHVMSLYEEWPSVLATSLAGLALPGTSWQLAVEYKLHTKC